MQKHSPQGVFMASSIRYTRKGDIHTFETDLSGMEKLVIDHTGVPPEQRGGTAKLLLEAAAIACYSASLAGALEARKADYASITATAALDFGADAVGRSRITGMKLDFSVELDAADAPIFERCAKLMRNGCLVTGSLHDGIDMAYTLNAVYKNTAEE